MARSQKFRLEIEKRADPRAQMGFERESSQSAVEERRRDRQVDRDWYEMEESSAVDTSKQDPLSYRSLFHRDQRKWEETLISRTSKGFRSVVGVEDESDGPKLHIMVHNVSPDFLEGKSNGPLQFSSELKQVSVVRDPSSDLAVSAREGSDTLKELREQNERGAMRDKFWQVAGSRMGDAVGVESEKEDVDILKDPKDDLQYAKHLQKSQAASEFSKTKTIKQQREFLPIFSVRETLMQVIRDNNVVVIVGETGSGKSTQMTQYLLEEGYGDLGVIGCTQPRRVAAMSVAKRVSEEFGCSLGEEVGYAIRFESCFSEKTKIKYMTDGILLRESLRDPELSGYSCVIMDEAHERSLNTDVLFGIVRKVLSRRMDFKLIVTSATLDASKFSRFFGDCPVFRIPGRTFKVDTFFKKTPSMDYLDSTVRQILSIHVSHPEGDILVFMTGQEDIEAACVILAEKIQQDPKGFPPLSILPIYSQLPSDLQTKIFDKAEPGTRKCIIGTNIAETSLTVDGIKYVVDCGFCKLKVFNPKIGMDSLLVTPISQANADQRAGRAGRTGPGCAYRLYTERQYVSEMLKMTVPEIQRTNLSNVVLLLKSLGVQNVCDFDFMDPPSKATLLNSMSQLWILGALDRMGQLTSLGGDMAEFPLDPPLSKMLLFGARLGCSDEVMTIVSMLSVPSVFYRPSGKSEKSDAVHEKFFVPESDHLTFLNVFQQWERHGFTSKWCSKHFMHFKALKRVREIRSQLYDLMQSKRIPAVSCGRDWDLVRKAICSGYFHNAAKMKGIGTFVNIRSGTPCHLHPTSALSGLGTIPEYVIYHELMLTSKEYMRTVTSIEGVWLAELAPDFFSVKGALHSTNKTIEFVRQKDASVYSFGNSSEVTENIEDPPVKREKLKKRRRIGI